MVGEGGSANGKNFVIGAQQVHDALAHGGQKSGEQRVIFGEAAAAAHGRYKHAGLMALGQCHDDIPRASAVYGGTHDKSGCLCGIKRMTYGRQRLRVGASFKANAAQRDGLTGLVPVIRRNGDKHRAARLLHGDVVGAGQCLGNIFCASGFAAPLDIGLGQL